MDLDDEGRSNGGEQTSLRPKSTHVRLSDVYITYEYQRCVRILVMLLHEFSIVFLGLLAIMFIEPGTKILL